MNPDLDIGSSPEVATCVEQARRRPYQVTFRRGLGNQKNGLGIIVKHYSIIIRQISIPTINTS